MFVFKNLRLCLLVLILLAIFSHVGSQHEEEEKEKEKEEGARKGEKNATASGKRMKKCKRAWRLNLYPLGIKLF